MTFFLYQYTNKVNGKCYVGITIDPIRRKKLHDEARSDARFFNRAVKKYGIGAFEYKILATFDDLTAAAYHEQAAIQKLGALAPDGYNLTGGTPNTKYSGPHSVEMRAKIGASHLGIRPSAETRAKMSAAKKGRPTYMKGKHHTPETRAKISMAKMGRVSPRKGKKHSPESRKKMSDSHKGIPMSLERRVKMSISQKAAWLRRRCIPCSK